MTWPNRPTFQTAGWLDLWWTFKSRNTGQLRFEGTCGYHAVRALQQRLIEAGFKSRLPMVIDGRTIDPRTLAADGAWGAVTQLCVYLAAQQNGADDELVDSLRTDLTRRGLSLNSIKYGIILAYHPSAQWDELGVSLLTVAPGFGQALPRPNYDAALRTWAENDPMPIDPTDVRQPNGTPPRTGTGAGSQLTLPSSLNSSQQDAGITGLVKLHPIATGLAAVGILGGIGYAVMQAQKANAVKAKQPARAPVGAGNRR